MAGSKTKKTKKTVAGGAHRARGGGEQLPLRIHRRPRRRGGEDAADIGAAAGRHGAGGAPPRRRLRLAHRPGLLRSPQPGR